MESHLDRLSLRRPVLCDATLVFLHGGGRRHPVEQFPLLAVGAFDDFATGLVVTGQHPSEHDEVCAGADGLGNVSGTSAPTILQTDIFKSYVEFCGNEILSICFKKVSVK